MLHDIFKIFTEHFFNFLPLIILFIITVVYLYKNLINSIIQKSNFKKKEPLNLITLNNDLKPFGFAYMLEQDLFYSLKNPWQKKFGYWWLYDEISPLIGIVVDSEPIYFNYNDKEWLIEFWKGQYGMTTGGEIGIYNKNNDNIDASQSRYMSIKENEYLPLFFTLKKDGANLLIRNEKHWWLTGFKLGEFSYPNELTMEIIITFNNSEMCNAFITGLKEAGYNNEDITISNNSVSFTFNKPHSKQPSTKIPLVTLLAQTNNKFYCNLYNNQTKNYPSSLDKLNHIKQEFPDLYQKILKFGKNQNLFNYITPNKKERKNYEY